MNKKSSTKAVATPKAKVAVLQKSASAREQEHAKRLGVSDLPMPPKALDYLAFGYDHEYQEILPEAQRVPLDEKANSEFPTLPDVGEVLFEYALELKRGLERLSPSRVPVLRDALAMKLAYDIQRAPDGERGYLIGRCNEDLDLISPANLGDYRQKFVDELRETHRLLNLTHEQLKLRQKAQGDRAS